MDDEVQAPPTPTISGVPLEQLTATYIKIRDARSKLKQEYERNDAELDAQMSTIEQEMLEICKCIDANSIKTNAGTIIR